MDTNSTVDWFVPTCRVIQQCLGDEEIFVALNLQQIRQMDEHLRTCNDCAELYDAYEAVDAFIDSLGQDPPATLVPERIEQWLTEQHHETDSGHECLSSESGDERESGDQRDKELVGAGVCRSTVVMAELTSGAHNVSHAVSHTNTTACTLSAPSLLASAKRNRFRSVCNLGFPDGQESLTSERRPEDLLKLIIQLVHEALDYEVPVLGCITFTWLLDAELLDEAHPLWKDWTRALRSALDQGWTVRQLIRPSRRIDKSSQLTENMRSFLGAKGDYQPYTLPANCQWVPPRDDADPPGLESDFVLITDVGGLQILAPSGTQVTSCRLIPSGDQLALTELSLQRGIVQAQPAIEGVYEPPSNKYLKSIRDLELYPGPRYAVINGLSETALPYAIHEQRSFALTDFGAMREQVDEIQQALTLQKERRHAMLRNLTHYDHVDVCPLTALNRLALHGIYQTSDDWTARGAPPLNADQRKALLRSLISQLRTQTHYQLWILPDPTAEDDITEFVVKPGHKAMTEFWLSDALDERSRVDLAISEPSIVESLHSPDYWHHLADHAICDKDKVVHILKECITMVD